MPQIRIGTLLFRQWRYLSSSCTTPATFLAEGKRWEMLRSRGTSPYRLEALLGGTRPMLRGIRTLTIWLVIKPFALQKYSSLQHPKLPGSLSVDFRVKCQSVAFAVANQRTKTVRADRVNIFQNVRTVLFCLCNGIVNAAVNIQVKQDS